MLTWTGTKRIFNSGYINFKRNKVVSIASVLVVTITLSFIASIILLNFILDFSLGQIKDKVDVTIYFSAKASEAQVLSMKSSIEKMPEVASVVYISAEEDLADFRERHANDYMLIQALDELDDNPLTASLNIKAKDSKQYESIVKFLEDDSALMKSNGTIIDKINYNENKAIIDRLNSIMDGAQKLGFLITTILIIISILITFNTIRLTIYMAREEIGVMRLVGAENKYIRGPFIVEGIIYGAISSLVTMLIFLVVTWWLGSHMTSFLGVNMYSYYLGNFFRIFGIILGSGAILGVVSSYLAVKRYLRK